MHRYDKENNLLELDTASDYLIEINDILIYFMLEQNN